MFAAVLNITRNYCDTEDIVQETFLRAYLRLHTLSHPSKFPCWIYGIARKVAAEFLRAKHRSVTLVSSETFEEAPSQATTPAESCMRREMSDMLWAEVADLPPKAREAILLFYMEGFSIQKAAAFLGIRESAMKVRLHSARKKLREGLAAKIEDELRHRQPPERLRGAIMASLSATGLRSTVGNATAMVPQTTFSLLFAKIKIGMAIFAVAAAVLGAGILAKQSHRTGSLATLPSVSSPSNPSSSNPSEVSANSIATTPSASATIPFILAPNARVLHFPKNRSLGRVMVQDASIVRKIETFYYWIDGCFDWEYLAEARGDAAIPAGKRVQLIITAAGAQDLSPLAKLDPHDLNNIALDNIDLKDKDMPSLAHLTGLEELDLQNSNYISMTTGKAEYLDEKASRPCSVSPDGLRPLAAITALKRLHLPNYITDEHLVALAQIASPKRLVIRTSYLTNAGIAKFALLPSLEELAFSGKNVSDAGLANLSPLPKLQYLYYWGPNFTGASFSYLKIPSLKILHLGEFPVTDADLSGLGGIAGLERLDLYKKQITNAGLVHLRVLRSLKMLDLSWTAISDDGVAQLKDMKSLEWLNIDCFGNGETSSITDRSLSYLPELKNLRSLTLSSYSSSPISDAGLQYLTQLPYLEELSVCGTGITDQGIARIATIGTLKKLSLSTAVDQVTDRGLAEIAKITHLQSLSISRAKITLSGLKNLNQLSELKNLDIHWGKADNDCPFIPSPAEPPLDISNLHSLERLWLPAARDEDLACLAGLFRLRGISILRAKGSSITDTGLAHLTGLTNLSRLGVQGPAITDASLSNIAQLKNLQNLYLKGTFTDAGMRQLGRMKGMTYLDLYSGATIGSTAQENLKKELPDCYIKIQGKPLQ